MFVDMCLGISKREVKSSWTRAALSMGWFLALFWCLYVTKLEELMGAFQKNWSFGRGRNNLRIGEEAEGRGAGAGESRRGDQPGSVVLQEQEAGKCQCSFRQPCDFLLGLSWLILSSQSSSQDSFLFIIFQGHTQGCSTDIW